MNNAVIKSATFKVAVFELADKDGEFGFEEEQFERDLKETIEYIAGGGLLSDGIVICDGHYHKFKKNQLLKLLRNQLEWDIVHADDDFVDFTVECIANEGESLNIKICGEDACQVIWD